MTISTIDSSLLAALFGSDVVTATLLGPPAVGRAPWAEEERALGKVSARRRLDFARGRQCSAHAIRAFGDIVPGPVLVGADGAPVWPPGLAGSITHTDGFAACAVARTGDVRAIGLDAEPDRPLPSGVLPRIANEREREACSRTLPKGAPDAGRLLFCSKEAAYKAWYPLARSWLGFEDASVHFDHHRSRFEVELLVAGPVRRFVGRYAKVGHHVVAAIEQR